MEKNDGSSKGTGDVHQEQGGNSGKRIKCSIEEDAFCCDNCDEPLKPPIFQCPKGRAWFYCSSCADDVDVRSLGMERAVESIRVDCHYSEHGCTENFAYYCHAYYHPKHLLICPHAPCECPEPDCDFAGKRGELLDHLTAGAGRHKWPLTTFQYWVPFDLRVVEPGTHVLHCKNDGQLFLVIVQAAEEPLGFAVSPVYYVEPLMPTELLEHLKELRVFECSVSFSYSTRHRGTSTCPPCPMRFYGSRPPICVVPNKVLNGRPDEAGIVFTVSILCINAVGHDDEEDDLDDSSYVVESDEDMAMSR